MKRWRGDGLAAAAILLGAGLAWVGTSMALNWVSVVSPPEPTQEGVAFRASSLNSSFSVQGDYGGRLTREGETLTLDVPEALIRHSGVYGVGEARLVGVRLSLAEATSDAWHVVRRGELHVVQDDLESGEELWLADLSLELEGVSEDEAVGRWLVVEHQLVDVDDPGARRSWTYAHAPHEILAVLFGWVEDGC